MAIFNAIAVLFNNDRWAEANKMLRMIYHLGRSEALINRTNQSMNTDPGVHVHLLEMYNIISLFTFLTSMLFKGAMTPAVHAEVKVGRDFNNGISLVQIFFQLAVQMYEI